MELHSSLAILPPVYRKVTICAIFCWGLCYLEYRALLSSCDVQWTRFEIFTEALCRLCLVLYLAGQVTTTLAVWVKAWESVGEALFVQGMEIVARLLRDCMISPSAYLPSSGESELEWSFVSKGTREYILVKKRFRSNIALNCKSEFHLFWNLVFRQGLLCEM